MHRLVFTYLPFLSVLLCLFAATSWVRCNWTRDRPVDRLIFTFPRTRFWQLSTYHGEISIVTLSEWPNREPLTFFTAPLTKVYDDYTPWAGPQFLTTRPAQRDWYDFEWETGIAYTELLEGRAFWCHHIGGWVDVPPQFSRPMALRALYFPHWSLVLATALLPLLRVSLGAVSLAQRRTRRPRGACGACGYDLTSNTSGTCPECGTPVRQIPGASA